jgi:hypothetical protein
MIWRLPCLAAMAWCAGPAAREDTVRLTAHLKALRGIDFLTAKQYRAVQEELLQWVDARVVAGETVEGMNRELKAEGRLPSGIRLKRRKTN